MAVNPYEVITWRGFKFDRLTIAAIERVEALLGYKLVINQGSYNKTVSASGGTHDGGGAADFAPGTNPDRVVRMLRTVGFAAWLRLPSDGPWGEHIHAVLNGNAKLSPAALRQVAAYKAGRNGLANNAVDPTWRPNPIPVYREADMNAPLPPTRVTKAKAKVTEAIVLLREAREVAGPARTALLNTLIAALRAARALPPAR